MLVPEVRIQSFPANPAGDDYIVGDLHGKYSAFAKLLKCCFALNPRRGGALELRSSRPLPERQCGFKVAGPTTQPGFRLAAVPASGQNRRVFPSGPPGEAAPSAASG